MEQLIYGKPLALFQLGRQAEADRCMQVALRVYPRIAKELLKAKHRRPPHWDETRITHGGQDQAFAYWQDHGKYWGNTPGAIEFLRRTVAKPTLPPGLA